MDKNIQLGLFHLQSDGSWADEAGTVSLAKDGTLTSNAIDMGQTSGIVRVQAKHTGTGAPTITIEVSESVDGETYVTNATPLVSNLAKDTTALYDFDAKASQKIKIIVTEDDVAATAVTLSISTR